MRGCKTIAQDYPWRFWCGGAVAVAFGLFMSSLLWQYRQDISPKLERLSSVEFLNRANTSSYWFLAEYVRDKDPVCYRDNTYLLERREADGTPLRYVLASYPNGAGMDEGDGPTYRLQFFLPIGFPSGDWNYVVRTSYNCPPLLLVKLHRISVPVTLTVPHQQADAAAMEHEGPYHKSDVAKVLPANLPTMLLPAYKEIR